MNLIKYPCCAEVKYDGECDFLIVGKHRKSELINKYGLVRTDCPITQTLCSLPPKTILIGELYYGDGTDGSLYKLIANKLSHELKYAVFDILSLGGEDLRDKPYEERRRLASSILLPLPHSHLVERHQVKSAKDLESVFQDVIDRGYEGIVIKNAGSPLPYGSNSWVKKKRFQTADCRVVLIDPTLDRIEVEVDDRVVGVKVVKKKKDSLAIGDIVEIRYQSRLLSGSLRHPVFVRKRENKRESLL